MGFYVLIGLTLKYILIGKLDRLYQLFSRLTDFSEGVNKLASDLESGFRSQKYRYLWIKKNLTLVIAL